MSNYKQLSYGSSGDDVKTLQTALGFTGADVDGFFGDKTQSAVRDYQQKNGLDVDGIVGEKTWGSLMNGNTSKTPTAEQPAASAPATTPAATPSTTQSFSYDPFAPSENVNQANAMIEAHMQNKPGEYVSSGDGDKANDYLAQYENRGPFSYNFNEDAMYLQAKDNYIRQGQMAMMDTMGQAAALTGGYGNSFAQTAGQQMYNQHLSQLNETLPEFYQMAHDRYTQEGQELLSMYDMYMDRENQAYGRYQDGVDDWYRELGVLQDDYNTKYGQEWDQYVLGYNTAWDEYQINRNENWNTQQQEKEDEKTKAELLASAGDYSGLQALYGLTDEQVAAIKDANTPKVTGGTGGKGTQGKTTMSFDDQVKYNKEFAAALETGDVKKVENVGDMMAREGYDPLFIADYVDYYKSQLIVQPEKGTVGAGGGGGASRIYSSIR